MVVRVHAAKVDAGETGMEAGGETPTHMTHARLRLQPQTHTK